MLILRSVFLFAFLLFAPVAWGAPVNINTATVAELDSLPGIGPAKAQAIVDHRTQSGPFARPEDVQNVTGIGPATYLNIAALITVGAGGAPAGAPTPPTVAPAPPVEVPAPTATGPSTGAVNINVAGVGDLQNLPGIGPSKAQAIVDDRTMNGPFATCQDLQRVAGIGPATLANVLPQCATK